MKYKTSFQGMRKNGVVVAATNPHKCRGESLKIHHVRITARNAATKTFLYTNAAVAARKCTQKFDPKPKIVVNYKSWSTHTHTYVFGVFIISPMHVAEYAKNVPLLKSLPARE